jgi:putative serine protease PepD
VLSLGQSFSLTSQEQRVTETSRAVAQQVVQVENVGVGLGSGVIATSDGYIVTNNHVVDQGRQFFVTLWNGKRVAARLVGTSPTDDLAVLKVSLTGLSAARFANSDKLEVGQDVLAIGNPLGLGETVTSGVVSAVRRTVSEGTGAYLPHAIQTSAPINPGNSGGALVSLDGQVVGIPTLAASSPLGGSAQGIGFAIPSNRVITIVNQLITQGRVTHTGRAYLGVSAQDAGQAIQNNPFAQPGPSIANGVLVAQVGPGSPAARAGLQAGDVIVSLAGRPVQNTDALFGVLADLHVGQTVTIGIQRPDNATGNTTSLHLKVTLGELPANPQG